MKSLGYLFLLLLLGQATVMAQNVGIGTSTPLSRLHVEQGNVLLIGPAALPSVAGALPVLGAGNRLMWYADKAAFRVGGLSGNGWDKYSIGNYSIATGYDTKATSTGTIALGYQSVARGDNSIAIGYGNNIIEQNSVAIGTSNTTSGLNAYALGSDNKVPGGGGLALGVTNEASFFCNAIGFSNRATGGNATAIGERNMAGGTKCFAIGFSNNSTRDESFTIGSGNTASGIGAYAIGRLNTPSGLDAYAIGSVNTASAINAYAIGSLNNVSGVNAFALGTRNGASASNAFAIGSSVNASGAYSMALGSAVSTSGYAGAFALGDNSTATTMESFVANGFRARFAGGYRLFTNSAVTIGAFLNANANSWAALSDVRMKENFVPVDGESFLKKIAAMPQFSWNYKGQDVATLRHYGPMAQDFFKAFGKDSLGVIGCDTLINQQDFLGVNLIAIQALEKRSRDLENENAALRNKQALLEESNKMLEKKLNMLAEKMELNYIKRNKHPKTTEGN